MPANSNTLEPPEVSNDSDTDLFTYYNALSSQFFSSDASSHAQADADPLHFMDESLFFGDQVNSRSPSSLFLPPGLGNKTPVMSSAGAASREKRVQFSTLLNDCHQHRMSTIAESESIAIEERPTSTITPPEVPSIKTPVEMALVPAPKSKMKRVSWVTQIEDSAPDPPSPIQHQRSQSQSQSQTQPQPQRSLQSELPSQKAGLKKLLDFIVPYPTRQTSSKKDKQRLRRNRSASLPTSRILPPPPRDSDATTVTSASASSSESSHTGSNEEWVMHGFFEILPRLD